MKTKPKFNGRKFFVNLFLSVALLFLLSASAFAEGTPPEASPEALNQPASNTVTVTATLTWSGGPVSNQTGIPLTLLRNGTALDPQPNPTISPDSGTASKFTYTWADLPATDQGGYPYTYTVKQPNVTTVNGVDRVMINYSHYIVTQEGNDITNTFDPPVRKLYAEKKFESGDPNIPFPQVKITVERKAGKGSWEEAVDINGKIMSFMTKENFRTSWMTQYGDQDGNPYAFRLKETFTSPALTDDNWLFANEAYQTILPSSGSVICEGGNILVSGEHKIAKLKITKELDNSGLNGAGGTGDLNGQRISFQAEVTGPYGFKEIVTLYPGETTVLENLYYGEYTVRELGADDYNVTMAPADGKVVLSRPEYSPDNLPSITPEAEVTITNAPKPGTDAVTDIMATKIWKGGPKGDHWAGAPTISLFQNGKKIGDNQVYLAHHMIIKPIQKGADSYTYHWINLPKYDANGYPFTYAVDETEWPEPYVKTVSDGGLTFTNTYPETVEPDDPVTPTEPSKPTKPADPGKVTVIQKATPTTGDEQSLWIYAIFWTALIVLGSTAAVERRKRKQ
ncbi:MAG: Cna B-type domain-containing protein [Anaerovoracaceae bacterium]|jgi:hypothetical protein